MAFTRYIGIDYSGAETPTASLKGLRIYLAQGNLTPEEVLPPPGPRKYWSRRGIAEWLAERLGEDVPTLVGIDHGFSFPLAYFEAHHLPPDWPAFLEDFQRNWPTDEDYVYVDFVRDGLRGDGAARSGNTRWRRLTEQSAGAAKSVFHFDVQGSVAKSTHAGIPWLRYLRRQLGSRIHFWPFDGWTAPPGKSVVAEVYPALWKNAYAPEGRTPDQHDAYTIAAWLRQADLDGRLQGLLEPTLSPAERTIAGVEGWILGVERSASAAGRLKPAKAGRRDAPKAARLSEAFALSLAVCHFPPGTCKWNRIEHRLFSFISSNWRDEPLRDYETIVNLIAKTTTARGLKVTCRLDRRKYPTGRKVSDDEMKGLNMERNKFHGKWNYVIRPKTKA